MKYIGIVIVAMFIGWTVYAATYTAVDGKLRTTEEVSRDRSLTDLKGFAASLTQDVARKQVEIAQLEEQIEKINFMINEAEKLGLKEDANTMWNPTIREDL